MPRVVPGGFGFFSAGGDGGAATATASAINSLGGASASVTVTGGAGNSGDTQGGNGASIDLENAVSGSSPTDLRLSQEADAGSGGAAHEGGVGGQAGNAISRLTATNPGGGFLFATVKAVGGTGGFAQDMQGNVTSVPGGSAIAMLNLTGSDGINGSAEADAGAAGGPVFGTGLPIPGADATAVANAILTAEDEVGLHISATAAGGAGYPSISGLPAAGGAALARASGTETFARTGFLVSDVSALAVTQGAYFVGLNARVNSVVYDGTSTPEARAAMGRPVPAASLANGLQAASFVTGLPSQSDLQMLEEGHKNVQNAFSNGATSVAVIDFAAKSYSTKSNTTSSFASDASMFLQSSLLPSTEFQIGLLDGIATDGKGFEQLHFLD